MVIDHSLHLIIPLFVLFVSGSLGWGWSLLYVCGLWKHLPNFMYRLFFSGLLGILVQGDLILVFGLLGRLEKSALLLLFFAGLFLGIYFLYVYKKKVKDSVAVEIFAKTEKRHIVIFLVLSVPFLVLIFLHSLAPDLSGDAYLYHITVPNFYAQEGKIVRVPMSFCYNYPLQIEMYILAAIRLGQEQAGVMMNFALAVLSLIGIIILGTLLRSRFVGFLSGFVFISLPIVMRIASSSLVDLSSAPFILGAFICLYKWEKKREKQLLFLGGICGGGAVAIKLFMGFASFIILPLAVCAFSIKMRKEGDFLIGNIIRTIKNLVLYGAAVFCPVFPWMLKNALFTKNPFYPFLIHVLPTRGDLVESALVLHRLHGIPPVQGFFPMMKRSFGIFSLLAWDANWLIIGAMIMAPVFFVIMPGKRNIRTFFGIQIVLAAFMLYYGRNAQVRWFLGFFPVFIVGLILGLDTLVHSNRRARFYVIFFLVCLCFVIAGKFYYFRIKETGYYPWLAFSQKSLSEYMKHQNRVKEGDFINRGIPPGGKVFLLDREILSIGRWLRRRFVQGGGLCFKRWEKQNTSIDEILRDLKTLEVTHIGASRLLENKLFFRLKKEYLRVQAVHPTFTLYKVLYPPGL